MADEFQKKYAEDVKNGLFSFLMLRNTGVATEFENLCGKKFLKVIPTFYDSIDSSYYNKDVISDLALRRYNYMYARQIEQKDIDILKTELEFPENRKKQISTIDFGEIAKKVTKNQNLFFNQSTLDFFTKNNEFDSAGYFNYLRILSEKENSKFFIIEEDPLFSGSLSQESIRAFVEKYVPRINRLKPLFSKFSEYSEYYFDIVPIIFNFYLSPMQNFNISGDDFFSSHLFFQFVDMDNMPNKNNPFAIKKIIDICKMYDRLKSEDSGIIYEDKLKRIDKIVLTDVFIKQLFETLQIYEGGFDFTLFVIFLLSLRNLSKPYISDMFFRTIDLDDDGYITHNDILYFYKAILAESQIENNNFDTFIAELFDVVGIRSDKITKEMLIASKNQEIFYKLLIDLKTFQIWENPDDEENEDGEKCGENDDEYKSGENDEEEEYYSDLE